MHRKKEKTMLKEIRSSFTPILRRPSLFDGPQGAVIFGLLVALVSSWIFILLALYAR